ncbi:ankyrin repeat-containing domain protein [Trichoderma afarasin]
MAQTKDLFQAVQDGDLSIFQGLPATEIIDSHKDEDGNTLLSIAAKNGRKEAVQLLLEKYNANIYAENSFQATPLKYAAEYGYKDVVEILLQYANKIDSGAYGQAVSAAASMGHEDIIKLMLENNEIDEEARNKYGSRAIVVATVYGKTAIVKHLLGRDDINLNPAARHRALIEGAIKGNDDAVKLLLKSRHIKVNEADGKGRVPLVEAARKGHTKIIELLFMMENINVNVRSNQKTALNVAMDKNHDKVVELLFTRKDLDLEAAGVTLRRVIDWAGDREHNDLKDFILASKSELPGRTTLSYFAENGEVEILEILLPEFDEDLRSKSNIQDHDGRTPLSRAAEKGRRAAVFFLMQRDADVNLADRDGRTPLWVAVENGHEGVVKDLVSVDTGTLLLLTQEGKQAAAIKLMQHKGLEIDQKDAQGRTALHLAALLGHYDIARHLLLLSKAKEIINSKDHTGETPLRLAIGGKHKSIVQELLNHKADTKDIEAKEWQQLKHMGNKLEMINFLAKDAQQLANLRSILASQTSDSEEFLKYYCLRFHREQALQDITMRFLKEEFQAGITQRLENLDQSVRDLLQFVGEATYLGGEEFLLS